MVDQGRTSVGDMRTLSQEIDIMARALIDLFGDRAREVGERQVASDESAASGAIWQQIVERVGRLRA